MRAVHNLTYVIEPANLWQLANLQILKLNFIKYI